MRIRASPPRRSSSLCIRGVEVVHSRLHPPCSRIASEERRPASTDLRSLLQESPLRPSGPSRSCRPSAGARPRFPHLGEPPSTPRFDTPLPCHPRNPPQRGICLPWHRPRPGPGRANESAPRRSERKTGRDPSVAVAAARRSASRTARQEPPPAAGSGPGPPAGLSMLPRELANRAAELLEDLGDSLPINLTEWSVRSVGPRVPSIVSRRLGDAQNLLHLVVSYEGARARGLGRRRAGSLKVLNDHSRSAHESDFRLRALVATGNLTQDKADVSEGPPIEG